MSSGTFFSAGQSDRDAVAKLNESKVHLTKENALLKKQLEQANAQLAQSKARPSPAAGVGQHSNVVNGPRAASAVAAAKTEAELTALRKEVATMRRLLATSQEEHRRQLEALVLEGVEHEERYRQLILTMDSKITFRDKRIAELRAELAASGTGAGKTAVAAPSASSAVAASSVAPDAATIALLSNQSLALQQILQIASAITSGGALPTHLVQGSKRSAASSAGAKRSRDDAATAVTVGADCISEPFTAATEALTAHQTLPPPLLSMDAGDGHAQHVGEPKRRGRPPGSGAKAAGGLSNADAAARKLAEQERIAAATREVMGTAAKAIASTQAAGASSSGSSGRVDFGPKPVEGYLALHRAAQRGLEASQLATALLQRYKGDMGTLAADFAAHVATQCGRIATREAALAEVSRVVQGIHQVVGLSEPFLKAAWDMGLAAMSAEACHINHAGQLYAVGCAIRLLVGQSAQSVAATFSSTAGEEATRITHVPGLCLVDFMCAYLHVRNRERSAEEASYALPQLLAFFHGLLKSADALESVPSSALGPRPVPEMVTQLILADIMCAEGEAAGAEASQISAECREAYETLCEHAGWANHAKGTSTSPSTALKGLLAKLRMLTALSPEAGDAQQALITALRPLVLYAGYSSITVLVDAFSSTVDGEAEGAAPNASRQALMQLLATALVDFSIVSTSPDWGTFGGLFDQFLVGSDALTAFTVAHVSVSVAVVRAFEASSTSREGNTALAAAEGVLKRAKQDLTRLPGRVARIVASRLLAA